MLCFERNGVVMMQKRIDWIDMSKGIGIILMIYGHIHGCLFPAKIWLCSFHMPLFFFLSGITYNSLKYTQLNKLLSNKAITLLIPYALFAIAIFSWRVILQMIGFLNSGVPIDVKYIFRQVLGIFVQIRGTDYGIGVWFIPCIFISFLFLFVITKVANGNRFMELLLGLCSFVIGYSYCRLIGIKLPWGLDAAFIGSFFMVVGYIYGKEEKKIAWLNNQQTLMICCGGVL